MRSTSPFPTSSTSRSSSPYRTTGQRPSAFSEREIAAFCTSSSALDGNPGAGASYTSISGCYQPFPPLVITRVERVMTPSPNQACLLAYSSPECKRELKTHVQEVRETKSKEFKAVLKALVGLASAEVGSRPSATVRTRSQEPGHLPPTRASGHCTGEQSHQSTQTDQQYACAEPRGSGWW